MLPLGPEDLSTPLPTLGAVFFAGVALVAVAGYTRAGYDSSTVSRQVRGWARKIRRRPVLFEKRGGIGEGPQQRDRIPTPDLLSPAPSRPVLKKSTPATDRLAGLAGRPPLTLAHCAEPIPEGAGLDLGSRN
jgi:hypothetical protein